MNIIQHVKQLDFPENEYVVVGSGILDALGIRKNHDIDFLVSQELFEKLKHSATFTSEIRHGKLFLVKENIEISPTLCWGDYSPSLKHLQKTAHIIDGVPFMSLHELIKLKKSMRRAKDFQDILLIENYLRKKTSIS
jgi:hypothetical protein